MSMDTIIFSTPLGEMVAVADKQHLIMLDFVESEDRKALSWWWDDAPILARTVLQLTEYFAWTRRYFNLPLAPHGTDFQKTAWQALEKIPYGETRNYREQAGLAGNPRAVRAIGGANNKNPILIIIPCHRVIGSSGDLVGYAGGLDRKKWLLEHEKRYK